MRWSGLSVLAVATCVVAIGGCGAGGPEVRRIDGTPPIFTYHGAGGMEAVVSGQLTYLDDEQCIVLESGGTRDLAVFPSGSEAHLEADGTLIVEMDGYGPLSEGAAITGVGGYLADDMLDAPAIPAGCSSAGGSFAVLQEISEAR